MGEQYITCPACRNATTIEFEEMDEEDGVIKTKWPCEECAVMLDVTLDVEVTTSYNVRDAIGYELPEEPTDYWDEDALAIARAQEEKDRLQWTMHKLGAHQFSFASVSEGWVGVR